MSTPAGWYPDPSDPSRSQLRWWDGAQWTEHVHAQAPVHQPHAQQPHQQPYAPQQHAHPQYPPSQYPAPGVRAIATPDGQALGNLGLRLVARVIDALLVTVIASLAGWAPLRTMNAIVEPVTQDMLTGGTGWLTAFSDVARNTTYLAAQRELTLITVVVSAVYTILTIRFYGATPGKAICRLRVRDWQRPGLPTFGQAVVRWIGSDMLGSIVGLWYLIDFLWPCWDQRRQALHDKLARTVVVKRR
ncbi:RDD family protein [Kineococcus sp. SYSU DK002]|uniref:RDD family protein n=1 Tax=Kineococcus sp. SYSU DK002 TaxID=3383123 RepID=UPI003D7DDAF4